VQRERARGEEGKAREQREGDEGLSKNKLLMISELDEHGAVRDGAAGRRRLVCEAGACFDGRQYFMAPPFVAS
jgi:hypothetical protein